MSRVAFQRRAPDERWIARMFDGSVPTYDLLTDVLSMGFDRLWWRSTADALDLPRRSLVLDVGCGTGALTRRLADRGYRVLGIDVSANMLRAANERLGRRVRLVRASVFRLPLCDRSVDGVASAFVLRNLSDLEAALGEVARVSRPGAALALVDITEPRGRIVRRLFDAYFGVAAPALGTLAGRRHTYVYLARSLPQLPPPGRVVELIQAAGFERVRERPLPPGAVTLWTGVRSRDA